ncbi:MAG: penicillin-binding protein 2 [Candidatus Dadabacteria bacterium]|nr:MAG: penicillin-binding protein 2 [Candidatus Dadabacteria bacterium]
MARMEKLSLDLNTRVLVSLWVSLLVLAVIIVRLWYLQIVKGADFRRASENNRLRTIYIPAPRGKILDRFGNVIVRNRPSFNIELVMEDTPDPQATIGQLADILGLSVELLTERVKDQRKRRRFQPRLVLKDVDYETVARVSANRYRLPGISISVVPAREYIYGSLAAHIVGYIGEISRRQLNEPKFSGYMMGDIVGQYGIEARQERFLKGERGIRKVIVNAVGVRIAEYSYTPELSGNDVVLTIDLNLQEAAHGALKGKRGAIVAMDPSTGAILALESSPSFNPNIFTGDLDPDTWRDLVTGPDKKLTNRAVQGGYPPGSVFKIIMAAAGLSEGVVTAGEQIKCPGFWRLGSRVFRCHKRDGHGPVSLIPAIQKSCDVYFYTVGQRLGIDRIHNYAREFGLGEKTGLNLVEELRGTVPSTEWKRRYFKDPEQKKWYPGETPSVAIGQGALVVTPLQMVRAIAAVVNGGRVLEPYILKQVKTADGRVILSEREPVVKHTLPVPEKYLRLIRKAMEAVVNKPGGTGRRAALDPKYGVKVAGKTGTSQVVAEHLSVGREDLKDHAWFVGYAPADRPQLVVGALIENAGHGGAVAAPAVKEVMEAYFRRQLQTDNEK